MTDIARGRGRPAVAASILAVTLIGGYFAASPDVGSFPPVFLIHAAALFLAFWFPALRFGSPGDVLRSWRTLLPWLLGWTLAWDLATAGVVGGRSLFEAWWIVYPAGVLVVGGLLLLHGVVVRRWRAPADRP